MPTPTYRALATVTLASTSPTVAFNNIPATYRDLVLTGEGTTSVNAGLLLQYNASTTGFNVIQLIGESGTTSSNTAGVRDIGGFYTTRSLFIGQILDYAQTDKHKHMLIKAGSGVSGGRLSLMQNRWADTTAINSITLSLASGTFSVGCTFNLYGVIA